VHVYVHVCVLFFFRLISAVVLAHTTASTGSSYMCYKEQDIHSYMDRLYSYYSHFSTKMKCLLAHRINSLWASYKC